MSCDVSLTPKKYRFLQLIIRGWFELGMSSLNTTELLNRPILLDKVVDLSSWKIESIFRIGLPNPKRNRFFGGRGILDTDVSR